MRLIKLIGSVVFLFIIFALIFKSRVGDVRPALLPQTITLSGKTVFAEDVPGARDLELSPGGTLLVSQTKEGKVTALPEKKIVLENLNGPHGLAFRNGKLFVAEENKVSRYIWDEKNLKATFDKKLFDLPSGGGHSTRSLLFTKDGKLLISTGSSCNVCVESDPMRAAIFESDENGTAPKLFAKGLRNAVFMTNNPETGEVWVTEMGRDLLGDNLPPEEINILQEGGDYGWPYCYGNKVHDDNFDPSNSHSCQNTTAPIYEFQAHSAPLGLAFYGGDLLVAYHGSWNRSIPTGYKVVKMHVEGNKIVSSEDLATGGRPVDILVSGNKIFISDDKAGAVYKVTKK